MTPFANGKKRTADKNLASVNDTMLFVITSESRSYFIAGILAAFVHGLIWPSITFLILSIFASIAGANTSLEPVRTSAFAFLGVGAVAFCAATIQTGCFEVESSRAYHKFCVSGVFWMDVRLKITFRLRCACYTCNYAYSAIPRNKENSLKIIKN
jgi:hypothetical protein